MRNAWLPGWGRWSLSAVEGLRCERADSGGVWRRRLLLEGRPSEPGRGNGERCISKTDVCDVNCLEACTPVNATYLCGFWLHRKCVVLGESGFCGRSREVLCHQCICFQGDLFLLLLVHQPGGQTICAGIMGCADTMAGSKGGPSNSSMESCIASHTHYKRQLLCLKVKTRGMTNSNLHKVEGTLHLSH